MFLAQPYFNFFSDLSFFSTRNRFFRGRSYHTDP